jgi:mRNA interferase HigB
MVVISYGKLREFFEIHADAKDALNNWYRLVLQADWSNFHEIKAMFNTVDAVAMIFFDIRTIYIRFVGTHKEYDRIDCLTI